MTPAEFDDAAARTQISGKYLRPARLVLVSGYSCPRALQVAGEATSTSHKAALRRVVAQLRPLAQGWKSVTLHYPPELAPEVRALEKRARRAAQ